MNASAPPTHGDAAASIDCVRFPAGRTRPSRGRSIFQWPWLAVLCLAAACSEEGGRKLPGLRSSGEDDAAPVRPQVTSSQTTAANTATSSETKNSKASLPPGFESEVSYEFFFRSQKAGRMEIAFTLEPGGDRLQTRLLADVNISANGQSVTSKVDQTAWEDSAGNLLGVHVNVEALGQKVEIDGYAQGSTLYTHVPDQEDNKVPLPAICIPIGLERTLAAKLLKPGELQNLVVFETASLQTKNFEIEAKDYQTVRLPQGNRKLLLLEVLDLTKPTLLPDGRKATSKYYVDEKGSFWKNINPGGLETIRDATPRITMPHPHRFDLCRFSPIPVSTPLEHPHVRPRLTFQVNTGGERIRDVFPDSRTQVTKFDSDTSGSLSVLRTPKKSSEKPPAPDAECLQASRHVDFTSSVVSQLAETALPKPAGTVADGVALEKFVHKFVKITSFSHNFLTASEVAVQKQGDCTEHAVLLAALARAKNIPSRAVVGLVYYGPPEAGFGVHMWNELFLAGNWEPFDATLGMGGTGPTHLRMAETNLAAQESFSYLFPVFRYLDNIRIESQF